MKRARHAGCRGEGLGIWIIVLAIIAGGIWFMYASRTESDKSGHAFAAEVAQKLAVDYDERYLVAHLNPQNQAARLPAWRDRLFKNLRSFGHMNDSDESLFAWDEQAYRAGVEREVNEEIKIDSPFEDRIVALLNDDTTEVGQVHLGIVHVFRLAEPKVQKREAMITNLSFLNREQLVALRDNLETWSQLCVDSLDRLLS